MGSKGRAVGNVYLDFREASDTDSLKVLEEMLMRYRLDGQTMRCTESWLNNWAQRVVISGTSQQQLGQ